MANKLILEKKALVVDEIASKIKENAGVVFVDYRGLTDEEITSLRKELRANNADVKVYKNTLTKRALDSLNINLDECVSCGSSKVVTLSMNKGGYVCANCRDNEELIDEKVLKLLRLYQYVDISKISNLDIDENNSKIISKIIDEYYDLYSGFRTKSKKFLKEID